MSRQDQPNPSAPPVQKLRLRFAKRGRLRFTSHRDVARTFERALRRAGVPMAYSMGFSPHPKVSWIGAAPTGVASEAEYVEIQVVEVVEPDRLAAAVDGALPPGLDILEIVVAGPGALADRVDASRWRIELPGVDVQRLQDAAERVMRAEVVEVERMTKNGRRAIDARAAIVSAEAYATAGPESAAGKDIDAGHGAATESSGESEPTDGGPDRAVVVAAHGGSEARETRDSQGTSAGCGILEAVVRQTSPTVRPDDVLSALRVVAGLVPPMPPIATRMAQGKLDDAGRLLDPLAADQAANRTA